MIGRTTYEDKHFVAPKAVCDIIMKGGITSGVVYPLAIAELAKRYRFANIGGTSAGAIAAAAAAAAEYGRYVPGKGFKRLTELPAEVGANLLGLFQPSPKLRPLFQILLAALKGQTTAGKVLRIVAAALWGYRWAAALGALPGALIAVLAAWQSALGLFLFGALLALVGMVLGLLLSLKRALVKHLPDNNFGLCHGLRQKGYDGSAFTEWLANLIDDAAGRDPAKEPLTFGDLARPDRDRRKIDLLMMTTNLMLRRPFTLPFRNEIFSFKRADFEQLFPPRVMDYLLANSQKVEPEAGEEGEYYKFPLAEHLPVIVAARMSLSFPLLISAVPLYAKDHTLRGDEGKKLQRCLFSDGGLSSNFPIHFFDRLLPSRPTFAISLDVYDARRDPGQGMQGDGRASRVWMADPSKAIGGLLLPIEPFNGLVGFVMRLIDAAKDWQDNLQGTLAGYRDRIVHIYLKPREGGLNIAMPPALVSELSEYGAEAGDKLRDSFNLDEHRWRRFLVAMERLTETVDNVADAYDGNGGEPFGEFLERYAGHPDDPDHPLSYRQNKVDLQLLRSRADGLTALGRKWRQEPQIPERKLPRPKTDLRITPKP
jgi:predicted acylesterase/phospholipase RssA